MGIFGAFGHGARAIAARKTLLLVLWLANLAFGIVLTVPVYRLMDESLGHSLWAERLMKQFDYQWFIEFEHAHRDALQQIPGAIIAVGTLFVLFHTLLNGGVLASLDAPEEAFSWSTFGSGTWRFFLRLLGLLVISLLFYGAWYLAFRLLGTVVQKVAGNSPSERLGLLLQAGRYLLVGLLFFIINLVFDYAKIATVVKDSRNILRETRQGFGFFKENLGKSVGLYLLIFVVGIAFLIVYRLVASVVPATRGLLVIVLFAVHQLYMLSRQWVRLEYFAAQMALYKRLAPPPVAPERPPGVVV